MSFQRTFLLILLVVISYLLWSDWQQEYRPKTPVSTQETITSNNSTASDVPRLNEDSSNVSGVSTDLEEGSSELSAIPSARLITVKTDVLNLTIDTLGGQIVQVQLLAYPLSLQDTQTPITLLQTKPGTLYIAQSGLKGPQGPDSSTGFAQFKAEKAAYILEDGQNDLSVVLSHTDADGVLVKKIINLKRGDYLVDIDYAIDNQSKAPWRGQLYAQIKRQEVEKQSSLLEFPTYSGGAISSPDKRFQKVTFEEMAESNIDMRITTGWLAMVDRYFMSAFIPDNDNEYRYFSRKGNDKTYWLGFVGPWIEVAPGNTVHEKLEFYVGPEITDSLKKIAPGLELTVDYGWFWPISQGLFWLMKHIHQFVGNWGVVIIIITLLIKAVFYPLSAASYRSMANMRKLQPKMAALKERHGDDKQKFSQAMMEMYKKEKINPLGGCLPILVQIPVFIALYWVLIESVEFRQAPFFGWIADLSSHDPYYILPIIMGVSMFAQQRLSPTPADPMQAKILMTMPVIFTVLFLTFPAGLMVYWVVNNVISIAQQWIITRSIENAK